MRGKFLTLVGVALVVGAQPASSQSTKIDSARSAVSLDGRSGERFTFDCPPIDQVKTRIYGTDIYTADSPICQAAVHAGVLQQGRAGAVTIEIGRGAQEYRGSTQNGVTSASYGPYASSYTFVAAAPVRTAVAALAGSQPPAAAPGDERLLALEQKMAMLEQKMAMLEQQKGTLEQQVSTLEQQNAQLREFIVINGQKLEIKSPSELLIKAGMGFLRIEGPYVQVKASDFADVIGSQVRVQSTNVFLPSPTNIRMGAFNPATVFNRVQVDLGNGSGQVLPGYPQ